MKKQLCLTLALLILAGIAVMPAYAEEYPENNYYIGESCGYEIWLINPLPKPMDITEIVGDYIFSCDLLGGWLDDATALYAIKENEKVYIKQAYEQGLINIEEVANMVDKFSINGVSPFYISIFGDINENKRIEVADVLLIQKTLAKQIKLTDWQEFKSDLTHDNQINLEDVILLQKKIAKIAV